MKKFAFILVMALATLCNTALRAGDYPTRPITLVAVFGAGSASDTLETIKHDTGISRPTRRCPPIRICTRTSITTQ